MQLAFSSQDDEFRAEVRAFIDRAFDDALQRQISQSKNGYLDKAGHVKWQKALYRQGWAAPNWPKDLGGPGWTPVQKYIFELEMAAAGTPPVNPMGVRRLAPVLMAFGSEEQKKQHLPPILASDVWWCQGFTETAAGSDLATLTSRADVKGKNFVLNGAKSWVAHAQWADWMFCLVRTDANAAKPQEGLSFLLVDMNTPGITVEPVPTLDVPAAGDHELNQVYFDDVKVPKENLIGELNKGWTYAKYLLEFERGTAWSPQLRRQLGKLRSIARFELTGANYHLLNDIDFSEKLADVDIRAAALEATEQRLFAALSTGQRPGPESSFVKCLGSELEQSVTELLLEATGHYAQPFMRDTWAELRGHGADSRIGPGYAAAIAPSYFNARKASVVDGANEIQRNIVAKLVLGL